MAGYHDLSDCDYFGMELAPILRAVGWLGHGIEYSIGKTSREVFVKLEELLRDPWQPMIFMGGHLCELCQYDPPSGHANLFVPNGETIFVCPELIAHYIAAHHYKPPDEFLAAVAACPDIRTMEYKRVLLESGGRRLVSREDV